MPITGIIASQLKSKKPIANLTQYIISEIISTKAPAKLNLSQYIISEIINAPGEPPVEPPVEPPSSIDEYWDNVVFLLRGEDFTDTSKYNRTVTAYDNTQISNTEVKFGTGSIELDGDADYITIENSDVDFGLQDLTMEMWINPRTADTHYLYNIYNGSFTSRVGIDLLASDASNVRANLYVSGGYQISGLSDITIGEWTHLVAERVSGVWTLYINGVADPAGTTTSDSNMTATEIMLGTRIGGTAHVRYDGFIDEARLTVGVARYTTDFSVPTGPFPIPLPLLIWEDTNTMDAGGGSSSIDGTTVTLTAGDSSSTHGANAIIAYNLGEHEDVEIQYRRDRSGSYYDNDYTNTRLDFWIGPEYTTSQWNPSTQSWHYNSPYWQVGNPLTLYINFMNDSPGNINSGTTGTWGITVHAPQSTPFDGSALTRIRLYKNSNGFLAIQVYDDDTLCWEYDGDYSDVNYGQVPWQSTGSILFHYHNYNNSAVEIISNLVIKEWDVPPTDSDSYMSLVLLDGPVFYWPMNGDSEDITSNAHHATIDAGAPTFDGPSAIIGEPGNSSAVFADGDRLIVADDSRLNPTDNFAYEIWFKTTMTAEGGRLFWRWTPSNQLFISLNDGGNGEIRVYSNIGQRDLSLSANDGEWHHFVFQKNGNDGEVWFDGVKEHTAADAGTLSPFDQPLYIGGDPSGYEIVGNLAHAAYYDKGLTPEEIGNHYNKGIETPTYEDLILFDGPVSYFKLDETGSPAVDETGNSSGTYEGCTLEQDGLITEGSSVLFGSSNRISVTDMGMAGTSYSYECWIKPTALGGYQPLFYQSGLALYCTNNNLDFYFSGSHTNSTALVNDTIYHVVLSVDNGTGTFYLNGVADGTVNGCPAGNPLYFGSHSTLGAEQFIGYMDEAAFYQYALTAQQALDHYNAGV